MVGGMDIGHGYCGIINSEFYIILDHVNRIAGILN